MTTRWSTRTAFTVVTAALVVGCDASPPGASFAVDTLADGYVVATNGGGAGGWLTAVEELRLGGSDAGPELFGRIGGLEADATGRIYVVAQQASELRAFAADGRHLWTAGREGAGPGELRAPTGVILDRGGLLWVPELGNARYSRFDTAGAFVDVRERRVIGRTSPWQAAFDGRGRLVEGGVGIGSDRVTYQAVFRRGEDGSLVDTLGLPVPEREFFDLPTAGFVVPVPYTADLVWTPGPGGTIWTANTRAYRLVRRTLRGDSVAEVVLHAAPEPVTATERDSVERRLLEIGEDHIRAQLGRVPDTKPFLAAIRRSDDGVVWVRLPVPLGADSTAFDRFGPDGRHLGRVGIPVRLGEHVVIRGDVIVGTTESERGEPQVVTLRLDPPAASPTPLSGR